MTSFTDARDATAAALEQLARREADLARWAQEPVAFCCEVLNAQLDPWQADVLDALMADPRVALRSCHGPGKTATLAMAVDWFTTCRPFPKVPTTAPTFNKQVRDILWAEIHKWWRTGKQRASWLMDRFDINQTRLFHKEHPEEWFAVGVASKEALNMEGYHAEHVLIVFDEAKGIPKATWEAVQGALTTADTKMLVASTPGGPVGEFYKVFTQYRSTWKSTFIVHPRALQPTLKRPEAAPYSTHGTYYSDRITSEWLQARKEEWGEDSPVYIARAIGDFPSVEGDVLIPYGWLSDAEDREDGAPGPGVVACDVARYGRDRTVLLAGHGGTLEHGESIARVPAESVTREPLDVGPDPKAPRYRSVDATADHCRRVRSQQAMEHIVVDDTGVGGGVTDILRRKGERVIPINFGARPTDRPKDADERALRDRKHVLDSKFVNLKAEMAWALRGAFELGQIGLARLPAPIRDALIAQCSMVRYEMNAAGQIRVIDPDEQDEYAAAAGTLEGKKSPDHFHALILFWWIAGGVERHVKPLSGAPGNQQLPAGIQRLGEAPRGDARLGTRPPAPAGAGRFAGQGQWVTRRYPR